MQAFVQSETFKKHVEATQQFDALLEENEIEIYKPIDGKFDFGKYQMEVSKEHPIDDLTGMYNEIKEINENNEVIINEIIININTINNIIIIKTVFVCI